MSTDPIAPIWLVLPLAMPAMVLLAGYIMALREAPSDAIAPSRRRIRTASAWLMLVTIPLVAFGFGVIPPAAQKSFVLLWMLVMGLLGLIVLLAVIDMGDTVRLGLELRRHKRRALEEARAIIERHAARQAAQAPPALRLAGLNDEGRAGVQSSADA